jgi:cytoplasmic iron level regulating protein YaaA (DUF328/UPF0246 family)
MLTVLSPAKTLDFESKAKTKKFTQPEFLDEAEYLTKKLQQKSSRQLQSMMNISQDLADLNHDRFASWGRPFSLDNAKQSIFAFTGDVYQGLDVDQLKSDDLAYAQNHLRILSGLYGVLKPLDLMQPYRLEMGTSLKVTEKKDNLYKFWSDEIAKNLKEDNNDDVLVNLASQEYFKAVDKKVLGGKIITPVFKDYKNGKYKVIAFFAKKARGAMARFIIKNRIDNPKDLQAFDELDYVYNSEMSTEDEPVFTRR